jgi:hypothetical protein
MFSFINSKPTSYQKAYPVYKFDNHFQGYSTNNKYAGFPPLMSDGRAVVGGWTADAVVNAQFMQTNGITNNFEYRKFMTHNTQSVHDINFNLAANDIGYTFRSVDINK